MDGVEKCKGTPGSASNSVPMSPLRTEREGMIGNHPRSLVDLQRLLEMEETVGDGIHCFQTICWLKS